MWSFYWQGKTRGIVDRATAQLPAADGGLEMVDVQAMVSALHVMRLQRLLRPGFAAWRTLVWSQWAATAPEPYVMEPRQLLDIHLRLGALAKWRPPGIWRDAVLTWRKLGGRCDDTPASFEEHVGEPLVYNRHIQQDGGPLDTAPWHRVGMRRGYTRLLDVLRLEGHQLEWRSATELGLTRDRLEQL